MKKHFLLILLLIFINVYSNAQQIADYYDISLDEQYNYSSITGGTEVFAGQNADDDEVTIPIGFSFKYGGNTYTSLTIGVNGAVSFTSGNVDYDNDLASADNDHSNIIAPLWDDLYIRAADNGKIVYKTGGTSPHRWLWIEWQNISWRNTGQTVSFKLQIGESTGFSFWYGDLNSSDTRSATIGMNTEGGNDFFSITPGNPASTSTTTSNNSISTNNYPGSEAYYRFTPKQPQNNNFVSAQEIIVTAIDAEKTTGTVFGATNDPNYDVNDPNNNPEVWYSVTIPQSGTVTVETSYAENSDMTDTYLTAYINNSKSLTKITEDDNSGTGNFSKITLTGRTPGEVVYFKVEKNYSSENSFDAFNIIAYNNPPYNDACSNFEPVNDFPYNQSQDASYATNNNGFILYNGTDGMNDGVWYALQGNGADYTINVTPDNWNAEIAVLTGSCGSFTLTENADNGGTGATETLTFSSLDGEIYYINIGHFSNTNNLPEGIFSLNIEESCSPTTFTVSLPAETDACEGDDVVLHVEASGTGITNNSYSWFQENGSLGIYGTTLTINNAQISDSHNYTCKVTNACGEIASSTTNLTVYPAPSFISQPQSQEICEAGDVSFTANADNTDTYFWYKNNTLITSSSNPTYSITNAQLSDEANYKVNIGNSHCSQVSGDNFYLTVNELVSITEQPQDVNASAGDDVVFNVTADGNNLSYQWKKDGNDISGATGASLTISNVSVNDEGVYSVVVTGSCGSETSNNAVLSLSSGISENYSDYISIYPNIVTDFLNVSAKQNINNIHIFNISGKKVYTKSQNSNNIKINLSNLSNGLYIIKINTNNQTIEKKFLKQ